MTSSAMDSGDYTAVHLGYKLLRPFAKKNDGDGFQQNF
jgi:hypothetical protein